MFLKHYGMHEQPFGVTPNPRHLYLSQTHREALASLVYGIEAGRGFMALIAKPGMGKTTLLFQVLERLGSSARTVFLFHTQCNSREFFHYLLSDLGVDSQGSDLARMHDQLNQVLLAEASSRRRFVLVIDEAQNLDDSVLETVRLLSDFETPSAKLMQIILAGQPQLAEKLARPGLVQLRQRVSILARLDPLSIGDTRGYISHRLRVAGYKGPALFTPEAMEIVATRSEGIPRNINNICFNALSLGFALGKHKIDSDMVLEVLGDLNVGALAEGAAQDGQLSLPEQSADRPTAQPPVRSLGETVAPQVAPPAQVVDARHRSGWLASTSRPALRVAALAGGVFVTACVLVLLLERGEFGQRSPLPQAVNASDAAHAAANAPDGAKAKGPASGSSEPVREEQTGPTQRSSLGAQAVNASDATRAAASAPDGLKVEGAARGSLEPVQSEQAGPTPRSSPNAQAITSRSARQASGRHPKGTPSGASLPAPLPAVQRGTGPEMEQKPPGRPVLPPVPLVQAELTPSLQAPDSEASAGGAGGPSGARSAPVTRVRVGSRAQAAKLTFQPQPDYPVTAQSAHIQGTVRLEAVLAKDGAVTSLRVLSGHPLLAESAEKAVARWRYQPTLVDGNPVEVVTEVDVDFAF
jgi:TonB family protein